VRYAFIIKIGAFSQQHNTTLLLKTTFNLGEKKIFWLPQLGIVGSSQCNLTRTKERIEGNVRTKKSFFFGVLEKKMLTSFCSS